MIRNNNKKIRWLGLTLVISIVFQFFQLTGVSYVYADDKNTSELENSKDKGNKDLYYSFPYLEDDTCKTENFEKDYEKALSENRDLYIKDYKNILNTNIKDYSPKLEEDINYEKVSLGGKVWHDKNGDGIQDNDEELLKGVEVILLNESGQEIAKTKTDIFGRYVFKDLDEGNYRIKVDKNNKYEMITDYKTNSNSNIDNDFNKEGITHLITASKGMKNYSIDAGLTNSVTINSYVWNDINWNGKLDDGENGIKNIIVELYKNGKLISEKRTDSDGRYIFKGIMPGKYNLRFIDETESYLPTLNKRENRINNNWETSNFTLLSGDSEDNLDIALHRAKVISRVWEDKNSNGIKDLNEKGISGVKVNLFTEDGNLVKTTRTNSEGIYEFMDLMPGEYYVKVIKPEKYSDFSPQNNELTDGNSVDKSGKSKLINVEKGKFYDNLNVGMLFKGEITTCVWEDKNFNGVKDSNEQSIAGVKVKLLDSEGNIAKDIFGREVITKTTDEDGKVKFNNLEDGKYKVSVSLPNKYNNFTKQNARLNTDYSNVNTGGFSENIVINSDRRSENVNVGLVRTGTIGSIVWNDKNKDGKKNSDEKGIPDVKVFLCDSHGKLLYFTKTDNNGHYKFENLEPGNYYTVFEVPDNYDITNRENKNIKNYKSRDISLSSGEYDDSISLGLHENNVKKGDVTDLPKTSLDVENYIVKGVVMVILGSIIYLLTRRRLKLQ